MSPDQLPLFQRRQQAFTAHIRDPERCPVPDAIPPRRMAVYVELIFNNLNDQLSRNFPVLRSLFDESDWHDLVRDFLRRHRCSTPLFTEIGQEFVAYLQQHRNDDELPFLIELAHYEYAELAVSISDADRDLQDYDPNGDLLNNVPVVNPTAWILSYQWPVHQVGPSNLPRQPPAQPTHLVVYRDRQDQVHFLEINAVTQRMLQLLKENPDASGLEVLNTIAEELGHPQPEIVIDSGTGLLDDLRRRNIVLGSSV